MPRKIVINRKYGGFGLSHAAVERLAEIGYTEAKEFVKFLATPKGEYYAGENCNYTPMDMLRDDPNLVTLVEEMGDAADGRYANLQVVEIPDDVTEWEIEEYDGMEEVTEVKRRWS